MPTPSEVREQLADILVSVVEADPSDVRDEAALKDLGVDSLALVEVGDELGRRFGVYLSDETVDALVTVGDAVKAVTQHDGSESRGAARTPDSMTTIMTPAPARAAATATTTRQDAPPQRSRLTAPGAGVRLALWFVAAGAAIGLVFGLGGSAVVQALGLGDVNLPPIVAPTTPSPSATPTPTPTPTPTVDEQSEEPSFFIDPAQVSPGERFTISGRFPGLKSGADLSVEVRDEENPEWDSFAGVIVKSEGDGRFETKLYTSRTGEREFRIKVVETGDTSPTAKVRIG